MEKNLEKNFGKNPVKSLCFGPGIERNNKTLNDVAIEIDYLKFCEEISFFQNVQKSSPWGGGAMSVKIRIKI